MAVMQNSIIFGGIDSADFGIYIGGEGTFDAPKRDVEMISIPGRNGAFALDKGRFQNIEVTYSAFNYETDLATFSAQLEGFRNAICSQKGYQRLTDTFHPDEYRMAAYIDGLEIKPVNFNTASTFDIVFDCKPQRFLTSGEEPITIGEWHETETASGSIASFEAKAGDAVKSLLADIEPIQSLNGYDKPWSGGAGKNKLPYPYVTESGTLSGITYNVLSDGSVSLSGTATDTVYLNFHTIGAPFRLSAGTYTISGGTGSSVVIVVGDTNNVAIGTTNTRPTFTISEDTDVFSFVQIANGTTVDTVLYPQIEEGSSATLWAPYSNICPISGHDEVNVSVCGVNVWDEEWELGGIDHTTGQNNNITSVIRSKNYISVIPSTSYYYALPSTSAVYVHYYDINKNYISYLSNVGVEAKVTPSNAYYIRFNATVDYGTTYNNDISINYPSTDHEYHAYNGNTYTTDLSGTRYGGTLDVVSGVLTVTDGNIASYNGETLPSTWISDRDVYASGTTPTTGAQVVYKLATPTTVQLTAQEVELLVGLNQVWANSGDVTVEYGTAPNVVINPTLFESSPMLEVEGYGEIGVNDDVITIQNGELGEIKISDATQEEDVVLDVINLNANDAIYSISSQLPYATMSLKLADASGTLNVAKRSSVTGGTAYISKINGYASEIRMSPVTAGGLSFRMGLSHTYTTTLPLTITINGTATNCTLTLTTVYNGGTNTISLVFGSSGFPGSGLRITSKYFHPVYYGSSTKVVLPSPMYIDLDLGEAYGEVSDEITSFNSIVQMPANPPTLNAGANEINFDNTITGLKVIPRWWRV